jgi:hypothetical protein
MSKHPGPWACDATGTCIIDANGLDVAEFATDDPETRAVLPHAAEMFAALRSVVSLDRQNCTDYAHNAEECGEAFGSAGNLFDKIESEIAAARRP